VYLTPPPPPRYVVPSELGNTADGPSPEDTRVMWITGREKEFDDIFIRFDTIDECERQTDGHRPVPSLRIASRGKKTTSDSCGQF